MFGCWPGRCSQLVTASAVSHAISSLEARVGIRLLNRTTRSVSLTDAGAMLLSQLSTAFVQIGSAVDALKQFRETPFGTVRINAPMIEGKRG